ncbi:NDP-hexose 2,3-dehydratase [Actinophytocola xinjiangensis]|uniref:NDP-hexose 2,3-dehydratase n=1 Tax=Actinophytocola xinjiangensis TaxID=485602 RepID=A0A7Z0WT86_9PSEU|nr:NDP-hexose 2,3-dehydratase family protein [Actinophytocola xinjiangensis]OLF14444.1 NDP-hexose 2,3-dehydratase [Actinophytocola xinjiangensis]
MRRWEDISISERLARSASPAVDTVGDLDAFRELMRSSAATMYTNVERVALSALSDWYECTDTGAFRHRSGRFFTIEGVSVDVPSMPIPRWDQPIIRQPEIGILGLLVKEFDGVLHCLVQLKAEPGNCNGIQVSPTVQATRSNYTRVHGGTETPYLDYFRDRARHRVLVDVRQSEQGSWFLSKRNRNMVVEVSGDVEVHDGFGWLTLAQVHDLLGQDDVVNMDTRSVLACLPFGEPAPDERSRHSTGELLGWLTETRASVDISVRRKPIRELNGWHYDGNIVTHEDSRHFDVIGVVVQAHGREVGTWDQPMIAARGTGLTAFLRTTIDGVPHVLVHAKVEPGIFDVAEIAPTVQCAPETYIHLPRQTWPPFLAELLTADASRIRLDVTQSEEGGRFLRTRSRNLIVDVDEPVEHPDYRWVTVSQLAELLRHSHYVNIQTRSLLACLRSLRDSPTAVESIV